MTDKEKQDIADMVETAKFLAEYDPQSLLIAHSNINILKARCELEKQERDDLVLEGLG